MYIIKSSVLSILFFFATSSVFAQDRGKEIFEELKERENAITYETSTMNMIIHDSRGRTRNRTLQSWQLEQNETSKSLLLFESPADVRGTGLLSINTDGNEEQKLYLPAIGRVQTISSSQRTDRFVGSDFTFEDLSIRNPDNFDFTLLDDSGEDFILKAIPLEESQYTHLIFHINKKQYSLQKILYFKNEDQIKELIAENHIEIENDVWLAEKMTMYDLVNDRKTELIWTNRKVNEAISEDIFTERRLRRGI